MRNRAILTIRYVRRGIPWTGSGKCMQQGRRCSQLDLPEMLMLTASMAVKSDIFSNTSNVRSNTHLSMRVIRLKRSAAGRNATGMIKAPDFSINRSGFQRRFLLPLAWLVQCVAQTVQIAPHPRLPRCARPNASHLVAISSYGRHRPRHARGFDPRPWPQCRRRPPPGSRIGSRPIADQSRPTRCWCRSENFCRRDETDKIPALCITRTKLPAVGEVTC